MTNAALRLFQGYGIELEYMIVDRETLAVRPIADELLRAVAGSYTNEVSRGPITWSNELALHVIELKCTQPVADLVQLARDFQENIRTINQILEPHGACLLGTAAHPFMRPELETRLWPHGDQAIYALYHQLFDCRGHGWSNLQSVHINLPFHGQAEFARLHTAIRLILPLIPGLAASSPVLEGVSTGVHDRRLMHYQKNQRRFPQIIGKVIPEPVESEEAYQQQIYAPIHKAVGPYDPQNLLDPVWLNSRGAIARFDRGAIEIRLMDIQESPKADLALVALITQAVRLLVDERLSGYAAQLALPSANLHKVLQGNIRYGHTTAVQYQPYLQALGLEAGQYATAEIWRHLLAQACRHYPQVMDPWRETLNKQLTQGTLAARMMAALPEDYSPAQLRLLCQRLTQILPANELFQHRELAAAV